ncbi:hypothetical protein BVC80_8895g30 [Macleaya cordata]|uniref:Uncharacterized protein n=1 Tax=Macleaya cordata TaxID=56857 RepID=A0A200Q3Z0_MACCD|nr:hypothetical protein BVC80_8895g30 [Macleaya cordata]
MVQLFLSEPVSSDSVNDDAVEQSISLLKKLESVIWSLITSAGRSESRLWLCNTISCSNSVTPRAQHELFVNLLQSKPSKVPLAAQVLQMIFERRPHKIGPIIAKKSHILEKFFKGKDFHITCWLLNDL